MTPKFRAWNKIKKRMFLVLEIDYENELVSDETYWNTIPFDDVKLMQSTGLKDKNDKEIYEGDIIKDSEDFIAQVVYDKEYAGFGLNYQPFDLTEGLSVTFEELKNEYRNTFEIIGNIYENPELLEGE